MKSKFARLILLTLFLSLQIFAQTTEYKRADLWQKEIAAFAETDKKQFPKQKGAVFVGSSSIRGWRSLQNDFPGLNVLNRGFGGSHLEDVNHYFAEIVLPYKPKLIVLYAGENDLVAGKSVETVVADYKQFVALTSKNLPKTRLIFVSIKPSPARWQFRNKFEQANSLIKAETEKDKQFLFVDVWTKMLDEKGEPRAELFLGDKIHMKPEGYKIWRETLAPFVEKGLKGNFR